jgi:Slime mold cyclic AMP receptor
MSSLRTSPAVLAALSTACISFVGSVIVIAAHLLAERWEVVKARVHFRDLVFWLSVTAAIVNLNYIIIYADLHLLNDGLCVFHGFVMEWAEVAQVGWSVAIGYYCFAFHRALIQVPVNRNLVREMKRKNVWFHFFVWLFATFNASVVLALGSYGWSAGGSWCWIADGQTAVRFALWYSFLWLSCLVMLVLWLYIVRTGSALKQDFLAPMPEWDVYYVLVTRTGFLYIAAFLFAWIAPTVNRIWAAAAADGVTPEWINILHALTGARATGYTNFFIFLYTFWLYKRSGLATGRNRHQSAPAPSLASTKENTDSESTSRSQLLLVDDDADDNDNDDDDDERDLID